MTSIEAEEVDPRVALDALAQKRFGVVVLLILSFLAGALPIEMVYFPGREGTYLLVIGLQLGVSSIALSLSRVRPRKVRSVVTGWAALMGLLIVAYYPLVGADATLAMAALTCLTGAVGVLLPLSLRHHLVVCAACWMGLGSLFLLGIPSSLPWAYLFLTFCAVTMLSSVGVASMDRFRIDAVRREAALERVQMDLRAALGRAETAVEQRSRLIADVSHEVRTPVNVILGYADMLLDDSTGTEGSADLARRIHDHGVSLDALVTQLLDLSRLSGGRLEIARDRVQIDALLDEIVGGGRLQVRGKPIRVETDSCGGEIVTDGLRLRQILRNLVTNAARATERGSIVVRARRRPGGCVFTVSDTGCGIAADEQDRIFAAFEQLGGRPGEGIGLGLAIVRQLAEALGGRVSVHSTPGRGSVFTVDLPLPVDAPSVRRVVRRDGSSLDPDRAGHGPAGGPRAVA